MRRTIVFAAFMAAVAAASCTKEPACPEYAAENDTWEGNLSRLTVEACTGSTRATGVTNDSESTIKSLQVFIFDSSGNFERAASSESSAVEMECFPGNITIVAIANAPTISQHGISKKEDLDKLTTNLSDNETGKFVMYGSETHTLSAGDSSPVSVTVSRKVARIVLDQITNNVDGTYLSSTDLTIGNIYLVNVAGDAPFNWTSAPTQWYNKQKYTSTASVNGFLYESVGKTVAKGGKHSTKHYFYCYPNPTETDSYASAWSPRCTRLVVEATLAGHKWYYPITIKGLQANHSYEITNLTISGPGGSSPDGAGISDYNYGMAVNLWAKGTSCEVNYSSDSAI